MATAAGGAKTSNGNVMRWSQNTWKDNYLVIKSGQILVFSTKAEAESGKGKPRINMDLSSTSLQPDDQSARRFTLDDKAMLVYFRCPDPTPEQPSMKARKVWVTEFQGAKGAGAGSGAAAVPRTGKGKRMDAVGPYFLGDLVGEGGYAKVKSGYHGKTNERVAAKIMPSMREDHSREILTMSALKHENIVELKDVIETGGQIYLIMELAKGGELFAKLCDDGRFTEDSARFYFKQILTGVLYCHKKKMCHRDLKLENLLLDESGKVLKITDFGFAKFQDASMPKTILGTAVYVAPEVLEEGAYDGYKADVWSCGVILYTLIMGNYPFDLGYHGGVGPGNRRNPEIYKMLKKADYKLSSRATKELKSMFAGIFDPDPSQRMDVEALLLHPWTTGGSASEVASMKAKIAAIGDKVEYDAKIQAQVDAIKSGGGGGGGGGAAGGGGLDDEMLGMDGLADGYDDPLV